MSRKQLLLFCFALMLIFGNGSGLASMIPVHLSRQGIPQDQIGFLFSLLYFGIGISGILAGWWIDRHGQRKLLAVITAAGEIITALLLLQARSFLALSAVFFLSWFLAGAHAAIISALVGLQAKEAERGRVFGLIGFMTGLGYVLSGLTYGKIVDRYGFDTLLILNLGISILWTGLTLFYKEPVVSTAVKKQENEPKRKLLPVSFWLVVGAAVLGWVVVNGGKLGITLVMTDSGFSATDISLTVAVASLASLAMPLLLGWLSDRTGRKPLLVGLNLLGLAGMFLISRELGLTGFCVASSLLSLYSCFSGLSNAMVTDLLPQQSLGLGLALVNSTSYIAGIFSSALLGLSLQRLGNTLPFLVGMLLPLVAAILLACLSEKRLVRFKQAAPDINTASTE